MHPYLNHFLDIAGADGVLWWGLPFNHKQLMFESSTYVDESQFFVPLFKTLRDFEHLEAFFHKTSPWFTSILKDTDTGGPLSVEDISSAQRTVGMTKPAMLVSRRSEEMSWWCFGCAGVRRHERVMVDSRYLVAPEDLVLPDGNADRFIEVAPWFQEFVEKPFAEVVCLPEEF